MYCNLIVYFILVFCSYGLKFANVTTEKKDSGHINSSFPGILF
jgi:hypothetical protein